MTTQEQERNRLHNKSLVEHFVRLAWNSGKFNLLKQLVTSDFVCHQNNLDGFLDIDSFIGAWEFRRGKVLAQNTIVDMFALRKQVNEPADFRIKANTAG